ncbi:hypothetical protein E7X38_32335 [Streptomyces sp. Akac8]|nr:hypothetical protein E7X38_32335 [Streptomyces sp. Akac8]
MTRRVQRAHAYLSLAGITVERVLADDGSCSRSCDWPAEFARAGFAHGPGARRGLARCRCRSRGRPDADTAEVNTKPCHHPRRLPAYRARARQLGG